MKVSDLARQFDLVGAGGSDGMEKEITGGYCGDLLSDVMGNSPFGCAWLTIQVHQNIVAVAVLREMAAIIICGDNRPDEETREKADQEGIPVLLCPLNSFELAGKLNAAGLI